MEWSTYARLEARGQSQVALSTRRIGVHRETKIPFLVDASSLPHCSLVRYQELSSMCEFPFLTKEVSVRHFPRKWRPNWIKYHTVII